MKPRVAFIEDVNAACGIRAQVAGARVGIGDRAFRQLKRALKRSRCIVIAPAAETVRQIEAAR